jgi:hypothetical protein
MQSRDGSEHCAVGPTGDGASRRRRRRSLDGEPMAVTAIDYGDRLLTVISRSITERRSGLEPMPFRTSVFGGSLGEMTWKADTWPNSLRNHALAVCKVIEIIASDTLG